MRTFLGLLGFLALATGVVGAWIFVTTNTDAAQGSGWRLIAAARGGPGSLYDDGRDGAAVVTELGGLSDLWSSLDLGTPPDLDFGREAVVRVTGFGSGSCSLHFDDLLLSGDRIVARASRGFSMSCSADAQPYTFVLAIDRERIPAVPFTVQVESDEIRREVLITSLP